MIRCGRVDHSLVKLLTAKAPSEIEPVEYLPELPLGKVKVNIFEMDKVCTKSWEYELPSHLATLDGIIPGH